MSAENIYRGIQAFNSDVNKWSAETETEMRSSISSLSGKGKGKLARSLKKKIMLSGGEAERISFLFPRYGIMFAKGVGRGHVMSAGKVVRGVKDNKTIRLLSGPVNRTPKDWWGPVLDNRMSDLADIVADHKSDEAAINLVSKIR